MYDAINYFNKLARKKDNVNFNEIASNFDGSIVLYEEEDRTVTLTIEE